MPLRISGNRLLKTPKGEVSRPTLSRVREAVFNIWQVEVEECRWLDLCAGSGSMGAEALCHGAASVTGIEQSPKAIPVIEQNWTRLAKEKQETRLLRGNVMTRLPQLAGEQFDLIYFDPPYASNLYAKVLPLIVSHQLLSSDGELAVEHGSRDKLQLPKGLVLRRCKTYGSSAVSFCYGADSESLESQQ